MRGEENKQTSMVMLLSLEQVVPARHPTRFVGLASNRLAGFIVAASYNLVRLAKLLPLPEPA